MKAWTILIGVTAIVTCACGVSDLTSDIWNTTTTTMPPTTSPVTTSPVVTTAAPTEPALEGHDDGSFTCRPGGPGPFPGVLYSHGGRQGAVGGDLEGTCEALADAGYLAHSKRRIDEDNMGLQLVDALVGLDTLLAHPDLDTDRVGIIGFSRGGLLTLQMAVERPDDVHAAVLMAPAHGVYTMDRTLEDTTPVDDPILVLVSENDLIQSDHVAIAHDVEVALTDAGKAVRLIIYPPYHQDGHELFFLVQEPYWPDLVAFLDRQL